MARRVNPIEARKGEYIDSVIGKEEAVQRLCSELDKVMSRHHSRVTGKEVVYTQIPGKRNRGVWQIFLCRKGDGK